MLWGEDAPYMTHPILGYKFEDQYVIINPYNEFGDTSKSMEKELNVVDVYYI